MGFKRKRGSVNKHSSRKSDGQKDQNRTDDRDKRPDQRPDQRTDGYESFVKESPLFEQYYKAQNIVPESDWPVFMDTLRRELPVSFRFTGSRKNALTMRDSMQSEYFDELKDVEIEGEKFAPPAPLPWYPNNLGWQYDATRKQIRRCETFSRLHDFLVAETEVGNISRQEAVSMIPPLVLDVKPDHFVLDMCAAPGSKTCQIVEMIQANSEVDATIPTGAVIANDADHDRSYMLVHQTKRLQSPCFMVTNHDASHYPSINIDGERLAFDRILADVPCSGDGTMRKNPMIWKRWGPGTGLGLHRLQLNILIRAIQMCKVGGRIVYSTCAFNPVENEAVVAEALRYANGALELVDVSQELPGLIRQSGVSTWCVMDKTGTFYEDFESVPEHLRRLLAKSVFPPSVDEVARMNLDRCVRVLPHAQNTGGFFISVLQKTAPLSKHESAPTEVNLAAVPEAAGDAPELVDATPETIPAEPETAQAVEATTETKPKAPPKQSKKKMFGTRKEEPFIFLSAESETIKEINAHFDLDPKFPCDQLTVRAENSRNGSVYFVSKGVKAVLEAVENEPVNVVNAGVKAFMRNQLSKNGDEPLFSTFRLHSEIVPLIIPYVSAKRVVNITKQDLLLAIREEFPLFTSFSDSAREALEQMSPGGCVFFYDPVQDEAEQNDKLHELNFSVWRARKSVNVLMNKKERRSVLMRFFGAAEANGINENEPEKLEAGQ